jgi:hypothetical protein
MDELKFDIYAMVRPQSHADLLQLAREALAELAIINAILDDLLTR